MWQKAHNQEVETFSEPITHLVLTHRESPALQGQDSVESRILDLAWSVSGYLQHLLVGGVFAILATQLFTENLQLPSELDHPLCGCSVPSTQLPVPGTALVF